MKKFSQICMLIVLLGVLFLNLKCANDNPITPPDKTFTLTVEDASCTEVWLKIKVGQGNASREVTLKRDTITLFTRTLNDLETVVIDTNLLPNHNYTYTAQLTNGSLASNSTARTMDTTNHNFTWQTFNLGDGTGSSVLHDVAIINDTLAYAVGVIYQRDSTYNFARWDGHTWTLQRILYTYEGQFFFHPLQCIYAFGPNDIWIAGNGVQHWDGIRFNEVDLSVSLWGQNLINKIWGSSSSNLYVVGNGGSIAHYNGTSWTKIESGNNLQFLDIYGSGDEILAVCTQNYPGARSIFSINRNTAKQISSSPIERELFGVWFVPNRHYYVVGGDYYEKVSLGNDEWKKFYPPTRYAATKMKGNDLNDVFIVGSFGECLHWNGMNWKSYIDITGFSNGAYSSVVVKGNRVIMVGGSNNYGIITIGNR
jgi:hypothetical protein